jgi:hypothetical protein
MDMWAEEMYSVLEKVKSARLEANVFFFFPWYGVLKSYITLLFAGLTKALGCRKMKRYNVSQHFFYQTVH